MKKNLDFFFQFIKKPSVIGAVVPSSRSLAKTMLQTVDFGKTKTIVELGPGTGAFSQLILDSALPSTTYFALELNLKMVNYLKNTMPELITYHDSAANIEKYLQKHSASHADVIISGLPWAAFSDGLQDALLNAVLNSLPTNGQFMTFAYLNGLLLPAGQNFYKKLNKKFASVSKSKITWLNFPPAFVYRCKK